MARRPRDPLPRSLQVLWQVPAEPPSGKALGRDRIVAAAIALADAEGLPALSMARLAERLGSATMSLYRHVASKDELLVFMMDAAPGPPPAIERARGWREGLDLWARALRAVYYRHPWILQAAMGRPPLEPSGLTWFDRGLAALEATRLTPGQKMSVILLVLNYVRGEAQVATGLMQSQKLSARERRHQQAWYGRTLAALVEPARFPALAALIDAGVFAPGDSDGAADFDFGLDRLLDGIGALVRPKRSRS
jgi:AcrR family transcriptional regulator